MTYMKGIKDCLILNNQLKNVYLKKPINRWTVDIDHWHDYC